MTQQSRVENGGTFTKIFKDVEDVHEIVNVGMICLRKVREIWKQGMMTLFMALGVVILFLKTIVGTPLKKKN